jgi:hypothetical protein
VDSTNQSEYLDFSLNCQLLATNFEINTKSLMQLIARDQGFALPPNARLWLPAGAPGLSILYQDHVIFTNVDTNIFNITLVTNIVSDKITQTKNTYSETVFAPTVLQLNYNGASASFTLTCAGDWKSYSKIVFHKAGYGSNVINSFSGTCAGYGTYGDQNMVIRGTMKGNYTKTTTRAGDD